MVIYSAAPIIPIIALSQCWSKSRLALPQKFLTWQNQNQMIKPAYHQLCWRVRILISNFHDCFKPFEHDRQFLIMYGRPTITKGQEKSEEGNSPNHPGSIFKFFPAWSASPPGDVYIVNVSSVFADNVSAMVRFEWNSLFLVITKYIFWPPLCLVRQRMKSPRSDFVFQDLEETLLLTLHVKGIFEEKRCPSLGCSSKSKVHFCDLATQI